MEKFTREYCKKDPVFKKLFDAIKQGHKVAAHTQKILLANKNTKHFCQESKHFVIFDGSDPLHVEYDVATWFGAPNRFLVKIESKGIYDDFLSYNIARLKGLHSTKDSDIPDIN